MADELSEILGRKVDLNTPQCLKQIFSGAGAYRGRGAVCRRMILVRLRHMLDSAMEAVELIRGKSRTDLDTNRVLSLALVRLLEIVEGEAASKSFF